MENKNKKQASFYYNKPVLQVPPLERMQATPSSFNEDPMYTDDTSGGKTAFQRLRNYDVQVNKVELNIAGAAEIFGTQNEKQNYVWQADNVGLYTGDINDKYANDQFALLSTVTRKININYWGVDFGVDVGESKDEAKNTDTAQNIKMYRAVRTWMNNVNTLVQELERAQYTDLSINSLRFQSKDGIIKPVSGWANVLTPLQYTLIAYQQELMVMVLMVQNFAVLMSTLPKLQELYYTKSDYFVYIQNQLKRSQYTSKIKSLMTWMKKRFFDKKFYKEVFAPATVVSKRTDGLNSPCVYLTPTFDLPIEAVACKSTGYGNVSYQPGDYHIINRFAMFDTKRDKEQYVIGLDDTKDGTLKRQARSVNVFSIDTILEMILGASDDATIRTRLQTWLETATNVIDDAIASSIDFGADQVVISLEAALAKLATAPGIGVLNWEQNLEVGNLPPIMKFVDWEFVNELAFFSVTTPRKTANGYEIFVPMYKNRGIPKQIRLEYFQSFYLASDQNYVSYMYISPQIKIRFRDNVVIYLTMRRSQNEVYYEVTDADGNPKNVDSRYVSLAFQDRFTAIKFNINSTSVTWTNPELMTYLNISFTNRGAEFEVWNTQNFLIPLG